MKSICVFCGSNAGHDPRYRAAAEDLGRLLARRRIDLVYGGGNVGLMGALADACLAAGGTVVGVIPEALLGKEVAGRHVDHRALTRLEVVESMHTRKARMAELADGFIALPGGFGTFEEFCEVLTWGQPISRQADRPAQRQWLLRPAARPLRARRRGRFPARREPGDGAGCGRHREPARGDERLPAGTGQQVAEGSATTVKQIA